MLARAQMTIRDEADVVIRSTAPASPVTDMLWLDTSSTPHQLKRWNGSAWVACGANVDLSAYAGTQGADGTAPQSTEGGAAG